MIGRQRRFATWLYAKETIGCSQLRSKEYSLTKIPQSDESCSIAHRADRRERSSVSETSGNFRLG
jgi:hypothetical protein